jgi:hypothetical protein
MLPPALHSRQSTLVRLISARDDVPEVLVLRLYDVISGISMEREITGSAQVLARHRLHATTLGAGASRTLLRSCSMPSGWRAWATVSRVRKTESESTPPAPRRVRSQGSRTMADVMQDWTAVRRPMTSGDDVVEVSCHLRSSIPSLPARFTYGVLVISPTSLVWRRWIRPSDVRVLPAMSAIDEVRESGGPGEWNIKRHGHRIVRASGSSGVMELAVPTGDLGRVRDALTRRLNF